MTQPHAGAASALSGARRRTRHGVGAIVLAVAVFLLLATRQAYTVPLTGLGLSPAQLILFVLAALWVVTRAIGQRAPAGLGLLSALVVIRASFVALSWGFGSTHVLSSDQATSADRTVGAELVAAVAVVVIATLLRSRRDLEFVLRALVIGGALSAALAVVQYATGADIAAALRIPGLHESAQPAAVALLREGLVRAQGSAAAPLELGAVATLLVPVGAGLFFAARRRGERAWFWALAALVTAAGGLVTLSRSVVIGLAVAFVVMMIRWRPRRTLGVLSAAVVVVFVALASGTRVVSAVVTVLTQGSNDFSLGSRSRGRTYVFMHFTDHLWLGQGPGTYDLTRQPVLDNQYLSQLIETGVVGLLLYAAVLVCAFCYAMQATTRRAAPDAVELATGLAGALAAVLVVSAVLDTAGFVQVFTLIWLLVGLTAAIWRINVRDTRSDQEPDGTNRGDGSLIAHRAPRASTSG